MKIPNFIMQLAGKKFDDKTIVRVISMDCDSDDVTISVDDKDRGYKMILPLGKVLNILGYHNEPITKVLEKKAEEKENKDVQTKSY